MGSFSLSGGVEVFGFISPSNTTDQYPVIDPLYGIDGLRNVDTLSDLDLIPTLRRRAGMLVGVSGGTIYYKLNQPPWNGTLSDWSIFELGFTGGTVTGNTIFTNGVTANTFSAATYLGLPSDIYVTGFTDTFVTGATFSGTSLIISQNENQPNVTANISTVSLSGALSSVTFNIVTTGGISASTISATTYQNLPTDIYVTGGTYSGGTLTLTNTSGSSINILGFYTPTIDSDATTFLTAGDYSLTYLEEALNRCVISLKEASLWTQFSAIYPFMSDGINQTRAYQVKYNLKDPQDTDGAYRLVFSGGVTYNSTGVLFNGVNGVANTFLAPSALSQDSVHMSIYSLTNVGETRNDMGSQDNPLTSSMVMLLRDTGNNFTSRTNQSGSNTVANPTSLGLYGTNRTASNVVNSWRNTTKIINQTNASTTPNNFPIYIGARNDGGTATLFTTREYGFATIGGGFTDDQWNNFAMIVQRFMFDTGRLTYRYN